MQKLWPVWIAAGIFFISQCLYQVNEKLPNSAALLSGLIALQLLLQVFLLQKAKRIAELRPQSLGKVVWGLFFLGLTLRLMTIGSSPWLEDDHFRYLWDGHVQGEGVNPYLFAPADPQLDPIETTYRHRINYPEVPTIYPPLAQLFFRAMNGLSPHSVAIYQVVFVILEILLFFLLARHLDAERSYRLETRLPLFWYWLSPYILKEFINSIHIDYLVVFFLSLTLLTRLDSSRWRSLYLGLAAMVKTVPGILVAVNLLQGPGRFQKLLFAMTPLIVFAVYWEPGISFTAGLQAFAKYWTFNDSLFSAIKALVSAPGGVGAPSWWPRGLAALVFALVTLGILRTTDDFFVRGRNILFALFALSPVMNPWYFCWILPFLIVRPNLWMYLMGWPLYLGYSFFESADLYAALRPFQLSIWSLAVVCGLMIKKWRGSLWH